MTEKDPRSLRRADFPEVQRVTTRWSDNDMFGHLNNAVYYELFDAALNAWLIRELGTDQASNPAMGVVAESSCRFYRELGYPEPLDVGVAVERVGRTSVTFVLGIFAADEEEIAAHGRWAQVYIDRETRETIPLPDDLRAVVERAAAHRPRGR
jgi:acyl-CoA thioester hydrolase